MQGNKSKVNKNTHGINEIVDKVSKKVDSNKNEVKETISELLKVIQETLQKGEEVDFKGYFGFSTRETEEKEIKISFGKKKGEMVKVPAKKVPKIKFSRTFKMRVNGKE